MESMNGDKTLKRIMGLAPDAKLDEQTRLELYKIATKVALVDLTLQPVLLLIGIVIQEFSVVAAFWTLLVLLWFLYLGSAQYIMTKVQKLNIKAENNDSARTARRIVWMGILYSVLLMMFDQFTGVMHNPGHYSVVSHLFSFSSLLDLIGGIAFSAFLGWYYKKQQ